MRHSDRRRRLLGLALALSPGALLAQSNVSARTLRILCLGDSMTFGIEQTPDGFRGYRGRLYRLLAEGGHRVDFIGTRQHAPAIGGDADVDGNPGAWIGPGGDANNLWDRLDSMFVPSIQPDVVILAFGWNSVYNEPDKAAWKYRDFVLKVNALRPRAKLVVATLSPRQNESESQTGIAVPGYRAFNTMARQIASASAFDAIFLADLAKGPFVPGDYWDGIHWFQPGADKAAEILYRTLTNDVFPSL